VPDLLPPSPLPLGNIRSKIPFDDDYSPILSSTTNHPIARSFVSTHSAPRPINYPALISDPRLTKKELDRVVHDLTGLLQDMYEGLNDLLGEDAIDE
jgi:hypothetical protein